MAESERNPWVVNPQSASVPPASTTFALPVRSSHAPSISAFADELHAVQMVETMPRTPR